MKRKENLFVRSNTRVTKEQKKFIKEYSKKIKKSEGYVWRLVVEFFIKNN